MTLKYIKWDCMWTVSNKGKTCKMSSLSNQKRTRIAQCMLFGALLLLCSTRENTSMSRMITLFLTFFHLLPDKYFFGLCCAIRQACLTSIIIYMPTITSNSVQTSLPLMAERKSLLAYLTIWMPISVHFRKLKTEQYKNFLTAWPKVTGLSFLTSSLPPLCG